MGAYNWIILEQRCPVCLKQSEIVAQCHVGSSYEGDETGRFHDRSYSLGQTMQWWKESDKKWASWIDEGIVVKGELNKVLECCYSECRSCGAQLYAIIKFQNLIPTEVLKVGLEAEWPKDFQK